MSTKRIVALRSITKSAKEAQQLEREVLEKRDKANAIKALRNKIRHGRACAMTIINNLWRQVEGAARGGESSFVVWVLNFRDDFRAPLDIVKRSGGSFQYVSQNWLGRDDVVLSPKLLRGAGKIIYNYCIREGFYVDLVPDWKPKNYCEGSVYEWKRIFNLVVSW